jgi:hypothetical protein
MNWEWEAQIQIIEVIKKKDENTNYAFYHHAERTNVYILFFRT